LGLSHADQLDFVNFHGTIIAWKGSRALWGVYPIVKSERLSYVYVGLRRFIRTKKQTTGKNMRHKNPASTGAPNRQCAGSPLPMNATDFSRSRLGRLVLHSVWLCWHPAAARFLLTGFTRNSSSRIEPGQCPQKPQNAPNSLPKTFYAATTSSQTSSNPFHALLPIQTVQHISDLSLAMHIP
jgi:hypothetical protein